MTDIQSTILEGLNSAQASAVQCVEGPVLIVAGAGSGKTKVLTSRIAYIIAAGCNPGRILALTFTKKAAGEMKQRVADLVGQYSASRIQMGTFHSIFIRFLRDYAESIEYPRQFTIYNRDDTLSLVKTIIKEFGLKDDPSYKATTVISRISSAKNALVSPVAYRANTAALQNDLHANRPKLIDIYQAYWDRCRELGVMDYDDILFNMYLLLKNNAKAREEIAARFRYILVDEYQDTNVAQYLILKGLCLGHQNICVVGDDSQSIYAFRGAKIENILRFQKDYPSAQVFKLEQNYRSTQTIVDAANSLIEKNEGRIPKTCFSRAEEGEKIKLLKAEDDREEAVMVVSDIVDRIHRERAEYRDFAVLYRTNSQSRVLEEKLRDRNIPYRIYSGTSFYDRQEVRDALSYFKLVCNLSDDESFKRAISKPGRGIGDKTLERLAAAASAAGVPLFEALYRDDLPSFGLREADVKRLRVFGDFLKEKSAAFPTADAYTIGKAIVSESGLYAFYQADTSAEGKARVGNLDELLNAAIQFVCQRNTEYSEEQTLAEEAGTTYEGGAAQVSLLDFLENISLLSAVDESDEADDNKVALMTVHSAKGLEFPYVFVVGLEENLFPSGGFLAGSQDIQEERRLFYVALTRAKKVVEVGYAASRFRNGKTEYNQPSRFLKEIDPRYFENPITGDDDYLHAETSDFGGMPLYGGSFSSRFDRRPNAGYRKPSSPTPSAASFPTAEFDPSPISSLKEGCVVEHNRFGRGTIISLSGGLGIRKAVIDFEQFGRKTLLLKYAKLRLV